jgi:hypothetical protein
VYGNDSSPERRRTSSTNSVNAPGVTPEKAAKTWPSFEEWLAEHKNCTNKTGNVARFMLADKESGCWQPRDGSWCGYEWHLEDVHGHKLISEFNCTYWSVYHMYLRELSAGGKYHEAVKAWEREVLSGRRKRSRGSERI